MTDTKQNILLEYLKNSTKDQRKQAKAIVRFISKLMSVSPSSTLEDQMVILLDYFHPESDQKHTKEEMPEHMQNFLDTVCERFYTSNKQDFANLEEQDPLTIILGLTIAERIFSSNSTDKSEEYEVYDLYHKHVDEYRKHVENHIINNARFDLTKNSEEVFKNFLKLKEEHAGENMNINLAKVYSRFSEYIDKYINTIKNIQQEGLDEQSVSEIIQTILINETTLLAMSLKNLSGQNVGIIEGLTDESTLRKYIVSIDKINSSLSLTNSQTNILEQNKKTLSDIIPVQSGCLGVLIAIMGLSTTVGGLITWTITSLLA